MEVIEVSPERVSASPLRLQRVRLDYLCDVLSFSFLLQEMSVNLSHHRSEHD